MKNLLDKDAVVDHFNRLPRHSIQRKVVIGEHLVIDISYLHANKICDLILNHLNSKFHAVTCKSKLLNESKMFTFLSIENKTNGLKERKKIRFWAEKKS